MRSAPPGCKRAFVHKPLFTPLFIILTEEAGVRKTQAKEIVVEEFFISFLLCELLIEIKKAISIHRSPDN